MKLSLIMLVLIAGQSIVASSQGDNYLHNRGIMERVPLAGQVGNTIMLGNLTQTTPGTVGDVYLTKDYQITTFWLYDANKVAEGFAARLDLQRNEFDIYMGEGNGIKALSGTRVRTLVMADSLTRIPQYFVNAKEYKTPDGVPYLGFFQILCEGEISLLKLTTVTFKPADTNPTHYTGSKDNRFLKNTKLYYSKGATAVELPKRKGIMKLMESHRQDVEGFIRLNEIKLTDEWHLVALFNYYNSLTTK